MSRTLLSSLPRFDQKGVLLPPTDWLRVFDADETGADILPTDCARDDEGSAPDLLIETAIAPEAPAAPDLQELEASLITLCGQLDRMESEAKAQCVAAVQSISAKLFPLLSQAFLAKEIGYHLPSLVPASAAAVEIRAAEPLAAQLQDALERHASLSNRCTIMPTSALGQNGVEVSWQTGGLTFDFDGLLESCLAQLNTTQSIIKE